MYPENFTRCPTGVFNPNSLAFRRIESEFWDTQPFCLRRVAAPWVSSFLDLALSFFSHQYVEIGNYSNECICFQTCNHDTRVDTDNHTTIFFILLHRQWIFCPSRRTDLQTVWAFHVSLFLHFRYWRGSLLLTRSSCVDHFFLRSPVTYACRKLRESVVEQNVIFFNVPLGGRFLSMSFSRDSTLGNFVDQISNLTPSEISSVLSSYLLFDADPVLEVRRLVVASLQNSAVIIKSNSSSSEKCFPITDFGLMRSFSDLTASIPNASARFSVFAQTSSRIFTAQLWNSVWSRDFCRCISKRDNSELTCHFFVQVSMSATWVVTDIGHFPLSRLFCLALSLKSRKK